MFLIGYGVLRFIAEYFREPDSFLGLLALDLSMGQWLCLPMIAGGVGLWLLGAAAHAKSNACDRSSSTPKPPACARGRRPHHRDRLRRDGQPPADGPQQHFYLNPQRPSSEDAIKVHGLTDEFLADKPLFAAVADELMDYLAAPRS